MSTQFINGKNYIKTDGVDGTIIFTPIVEGVKPRTPKGGDVWLENDGTNHIVVSSKTGLASVMLENDEFEGCLYSSEFSVNPYIPFGKDFTYKGKFHEVYINRAEFIADVRAALSHEDDYGDSVLKSREGYISLDATASEKTYEALSKLNIITDEPQPIK